MASARRLKAAHKGLVGGIHKEYLSMDVFLPESGGDVDKVVQQILATNVDHRRDAVAHRGLMALKHLEKLRQKRGGQIVYRVKTLILKDI